MFFTKQNMYNLSAKLLKIVEIEKKNQNPFLFCLQFLLIFSHLHTYDNSTTVTRMAEALRRVDFKLLFSKRRNIEFGNKILFSVIVETCQ